VSINSKYNLNDFLKNIQEKNESPVIEKLPQPYFVVNRKKLIIMLIITGGFYQFYWFYKNWEVVGKNTGKNISPIFRALFSFITAYWLFKQFNKSAIDYGLNQKLASGLLAITYLIILFSGYLPSVYGYISTFTFIIPVIANNFIMKVNEKEFSDFPISSKYTDSNVILLIVGAFIWGSILYDEFFPERFEELIK